MGLTVRQLITPVTKDQALAWYIAELAALGFSSTSWQSGSVQRTIFEVISKKDAAYTETIATLAEAGFNETSSGGWLTLLSASHYQNERNAEKKTEGLCKLTASAVAGPYTISVGQLVAADTVNGYTYRNIVGGVLPMGGTLDLTFQAETGGAARDVAPNTITVLQTPLAGVTINNPIPSGETTWITQNGADVESDTALRERNRSKWATLSVARPALAYEYFAREANAAVTRAKADDQNPRGPGTIDVYIAGASGELSSVVVDEVQAYFDGDIDGISRAALGADLLVASALRRDVTLAATIYILAAYNTTATQQSILAALEDYFESVPIGGTKLTAGGTGYVMFGELFKAILTVTGVRNVAFTSPLGDTALAKNEVPVGAFSFGYVSV